MHSFAYKNGTLYCENVNLQELADKEGTPLYVCLPCPPVPEG